MNCFSVNKKKKKNQDIRMKVRIKVKLKVKGTQPGIFGGRTDFLK